MDGIRVTRKCKRPSHSRPRPQAPRKSRRMLEQSLRVPLERRAPLLALPPELVANIAENLHLRTDLLNLRLVSKWVAACTEKLMLAACYNTIKIFYPVYKTLYNALRIAEHPKFGKVVRFVDIYEYTISKMALDNFAFPERYAPRSNSKAAFESHRARRHTYFRLLEDQREVLAMGGDTFYLNQVFSNLTKHGQAVKVCIDDLRDVHVSDLFARDVNPLSPTERSAGPYFLGTVWDIHGPILQTLQAIRQSGVRLSRFHVTPERFAVPWRSLLDAKGFADMTTAFNEVTSLGLGMEEVARSTDEATRDAEVNQLLNLLTRLAPQLRQLTLHPAMPPDYLRPSNHDTDQYDEAVTRLCKSLSMPNLEELSLMSFRIKYAPLLRFLGTHGRRLRNFFLIGIDVIDCGLELSRKEWHGKLLRDLETADFAFDNGALEFSIDGEDEDEDEDDDDDEDDLDADNDPNNYNYHGEEEDM